MCDRREAHLRRNADHALLRDVYKRQSRSYGRYNNVFLSDTELDELKAELPDKWEYYIDRLSTHIASKGTKYRSHAATIYKWAQEDEAKKPPKKGIPDYTLSLIHIWEPYINQLPDYAYLCKDLLNGKM